MKRFSFRLERIRKLRQRALEQKQIAHAEAISFQQRVEGQRDAVNVLREEGKAELRQRLSQPEISIDKVIQSRTYDNVLDNFHRQLDRQVDQVGQVIVHRRGELVEADRQVQMLDKLEQKLQIRYDRDAGRAEQSQMDELAQQATIRRRLIEQLE